MHLACFVDLTRRQTSMKYTGAMQAVIVQPSEHMLEERRRLGHDVRDEVWDGVLHMVPQPTYFHQVLQSDLNHVLWPLARAAGLQTVCELGLYDPTAGERNYRVPDLLVVDPAHATRRGVEGCAEIVIEILSPGDESRDKLPFYAKHGTQEVWLIDPDTRVVEVYVLRGQTYFGVLPDPEGSVRAPRLGLTLTTVAGPKLRVAWADGSAEI